MFPYKPSEIELPAYEWDKLIHERINELKKEHDINTKIFCCDNKNEKENIGKLTSSYKLRNNIKMICWLMKYNNTT
ncbi:hypothetical protein C923_02664 [Plasmodium falciparum UGT5.1]|uniref:Uncharacterized protein n=7 Tax=Plasmodium falciparum TaxID=5833 RepID=A0A024W7L6_PLAFA|nr:hypothetical protein PFFVO_02621 [Plasmodium falciparum Vietnam Oak-Knoll (FVO)]ETW36692.1 hypothetical protein PFTANZ_02650 [Plasmodium falciparum Tanzania (2000708)]ETW42850.1 hypothetical protein PFNF135_02744 [Plasmodium falciparum NF135/5.C10]ETW49291.1 hypothetical protein PFMALIP_02610 [Plasmodium falciparum MaliPS096_E11]ETW61484.1 hypothetical protein PFMC_02575 [Plasmodium falciparum CAMP/Malaysia]EUR72569.1 hypothetical protein PFBG_02660 [Plasmodium falciparum 7G8]EWC76634.1 hy